MRFLENSFKFLGKNIVFVIPLFIVNLVQTFLFTSIMDIDKLQDILKLLKSANPNSVEEAQRMQDLLMQFRASQSILIIVYILFLLVLPATYGIINRIYSNGRAGFGDFFIEMKNNILKFFLYCLALTVFFIGISLVAVIVILILGLIAQTSPIAGLLISIIMVVLVFILAFFLVNVTIMGFVVVVTDKEGAFSGISQAISTIKLCFWPVVGITILMGILLSVASSTIMFTPLGKIDELAAVILAALTTVCMFVLIVFNFEIYRFAMDKNVQTVDQIPNASDL